MPELNIWAADKAVFPTREISIKNGTQEVFQVVRAENGKDKTSMGFDLPETQEELQKMLMATGNAIAQFLSMQCRTHFLKSLGGRWEVEIGDFNQETIERDAKDCLIAHPPHMLAEATRLEAKMPDVRFVCWDYLTAPDLWYGVPKGGRPTLVVSEPVVELRLWDPERGKKHTVSVIVNYDIQTVPQPASNQESEQANERT